jgi:hypothetical protein
MEFEDFQRNCEWLDQHLLEALYEFPPWVVCRMKQLRVDLSDIVLVAESGEWLWADHDHGGCYFAKQAENCDGEIVTVFGWLDLATSVFLVTDIQKV